MNITKLTAVLLFIFAVCLSGNIHAQELITDRPDQTESSDIVPKKSLQVESGYLMEESTDPVFGNIDLHTKISSIGTLLRYGLRENIELRAGFEFQQVKQRFSDEEFNSGSSFRLTPVVLGTKIQINKEEGILPQTAFLFNISIPKLSGESSNEAFMAPSFRVCMSNTLSDKFSLGYNLGAEWDGDSPQASGIYSVSLGMGLTNKLGAFAELYGSFSEGLLPSNNVDAGVTYQPTSSTQFDVSGGINLSNTSYHFIGAGFSFRLPR